MSPQRRFLGPLFIIGMPRSGTKLLRDLLNQHPRIGIPDVETEFLPWLAHQIERGGEPHTLESFDQLFRRLGKHSYFAYRAEAGKAVVAADWYRAAPAHDAAGLFEALIRLDVGAERGGDRIWGDKSPSYIDDIPLLRSLYPEARILHIVRDVRDHCLSMRDTWGKSMTRAAQRWADGVQKARRDGSALGSDYLEVRYEDLLDRPAESLSRICDFAGIDFRQTMLELPRPAENLGATRGSKALVRSNHGKYVDRLRAKELRDVEALAGDVMLGCGYALALPRQPTRRLPAWRMSWTKLLDGVALVRSRGRSPFEALRFYWRYFLATRVRGTKG